MAGMERADAHLASAFPLYCVARSTLSEKRRPPHVELLHSSGNETAFKLSFGQQAMQGKYLKISLSQQFAR